MSRLVFYSSIKGELLKLEEGVKDVFSESRLKMGTAADQQNNIGTSKRIVTLLLRGLEKDCLATTRSGACDFSMIYGLYGIWAK